MPTFHNQFQPRTTRATVYQLRADVLCPDGMENSFSQIIGLILPFVAKSLYTKLPPEAAEHLSFEISNEDRLCECVAVPERMLWAIRFKFASKDGTAWYYDVSLVREDDRLIFGMKIDTAFGADVKALQANLPLVKSLLGCGLLAQGRPVTANLWLVNTPEDVQKLVALLEAPYRSLPVIVISAKDSLDSKLNLLESGAEDYLTKPFEPEELLARIRALLRRGDNAVTEEITAFDLRLTMDTHQLKCKERSIQLSSREFQIMRLMMNNSGHYLSKDELLLRAWDMATEAGDNCVEAYISFLRKKLNHLKSDTMIATLRKVGYRLEETS